ncbi:MAG: DUF4198 domain-containing protein [Proteobacteria bacterium]|nr:DUF4198 domain-containing protein [Pseudomonadota bacterium]
MKKITLALIVFTWISIGAETATAHFGMLIPSDSMVMQGEKRSIVLTLSFSHPFERIGMHMDKPKAFGVVTNGKRRSLLGKTRRTAVMKQTAWKTEYKIRQPGAHLFYMEPQPYWEPAEDCFIIHYTKTVVAAFGDDEGWDAEIGLPSEIVPFSKPFALYASNVFQGLVKLDGQPVPYAAVEVEYYNQDGEATAPTEYMIAQTIKADRNGLFTYAVPKSGWWGFAALNTAAYKLPYHNQKKEVELGAVLWVEFHDWRIK